MKKPLSVRPSLLFVFSIALLLLFAAGCKKDSVVVDDTNPPKCPLNMINPLSCRQGAMTYYDENNCSVTKCREDITDADLGILGSEKT